MAFKLMIEEARPMWCPKVVEDEDGEEVIEGWKLVGWLVKFNDGHIVRYSLWHGTISVETPGGEPLRYKSGRVIEGEFTKGQRTTGLTEKKFRELYGHSTLVDLSLLGFKLAELEYQERF